MNITVVVSVGEFIQNSNTENNQDPTVNYLSSCDKLGSVSLEAS